MVERAKRERKAKPAAKVGAGKVEVARGVGRPLKGAGRYTDADLEMVARLALLEVLAAKVPPVGFMEYLEGMRIQNPNTKEVVDFEMWPYLVEMARSFEEGESGIALKARQLGVTWLAGGYACWVARQPNTRVLILSYNGASAKAVLKRVKFINEHHKLGEVRLTQDTTEVLELEGGGIIQALPSTENAGRSDTASLVIVDEAAFHPFAEQNAEAYMATIADGGQIIIVSTSAGASGWFYEQYQKAHEAQLRQWFIPWWERPGRDEEWVKRTKGRLTEAGFKRDYPSTVEEAFTTATGLVFPMFSKGRHVLKEHPVPWEECLYRFAGYDLGGGDPTAAVAMGVYRSDGGMMKAHVYDLYYKTDGAPTVEDLYGFYGPLHEKAPFLELEADPAPGGETVRQSLQSMGLPTRRANSRRGVGLETVAMFLQNDWLTFSQGVEQGYNEFSNYRWSTKVDQTTRNKYATSTPFDHHADFADACRYALLGAYEQVWNLAAVENGNLAYSGVKW